MPRRNRHPVKTLADKELPIYTVYLDAGTFEWLHEFVKARAKSNPANWLVSYQELTKRAVISFQEAYEAQHGKPEPRKRIVKKVAKPRRRR